MNLDKKNQTPKSEKYKFCDHFLHHFDKLAKVYDDKLKQVRSIDKNIKDTSHGVCNNGYHIRYITPSDISTFVANLDKSLATGMIHPSVNDCNLFSVMSAKKFVETNGGTSFVNTSDSNGTPIINNSTSLEDLELMVSDEVFKRDVYTKHELSQRVKHVKEDVKAFDQMHFTAALRSLVAKLPTIIEKHSESACSECDVKCKHELGIYIGKFIIFALKLNIMSLEQMIRYAVPKVTFDTLDDREHKITSSTVQGYMEMFGEEVESEVVQESVDTKKKEPLFFVFSAGVAPVLSKSIMKATGSKYSHMGLSFDADCHKIYTFTSRSEKRENYVSGETGFGFTIDSIADLCVNSTEINIMVGFIDKAKADIIRSEINDFAHHKTSFDAGLFISYLKNKAPNNDGKNKYKQVCSSFCDYILKQADIKISNEAMPSPGGMKDQLDKASAKLNNVFEVFNGKASEYVPEIAEAEVAKFASREYSRAFDEVYTECFHITKVDSEVRSRIPFNCNFRDIVLADNHEFYKNTACALDYIVKHPKSPFNQLIVKYVDPEKNPIEPGEAQSLMRMLFGDYLGKVDYENPFYRPDVQFPSDPNWMDKLTYGNAYYDLNYRRDNPGNQDTDPITAKLDILCKMFMPCCHECDSEKLANNVLRIINIMTTIIDIRKHTTDWQIPRLLSTDVLALLGDILTRTLMKLYYLNTLVVSFSDTMDDTMIPGYMYNEEEYIEADNGDIVMQEAFITEADETTTPKAMVVKNNNETTKKAHAGFTKFWAKFIEFWNNIVSNYFRSWEKTQEKILKSLEDSKNSVEEVKKALDAQTFSITIDNYVKYNIQADAIANLKPDETVNSIINQIESESGQFKADSTIGQANDSKWLEAFESNLFPEKIRSLMMSTQTNSTDSSDNGKNTANENTDKSRTQILVNYILYGNENGEANKPVDSQTVDSGIVDDIYNNLIGTKNGLGKIFNEYNERVKKANKTLQDKMNKATKAAFDAEQKAAGENAQQIQNTGTKDNDSTANQEAAKQNDINAKLMEAAKVAARAERIVSAGCTNALIGCPKDKNDYDAYKNSFFGRNYALLRSILTEYKASGTVEKKEETTAANTANTAATPTPAATPAATPEATPNNA